MKDIQTQFVSYGIAVRMKELGFDEPCLTNYCNEGKLQPLNYTFHVTNSDLSKIPRIDKGVCTAPLWQQAIIWLSEVHNIEVDASRYTYSGGIYQGKVFAWFVDQYDPKYNHELEDNENHWIINTRKSQGYDFKSKHDALKEGISFALTLMEDEK